MMNLKKKIDTKKKKKNIKNENSLINYKRFLSLIYLKEREISDELVRKHFFVQDLRELLEKLKKLKNHPEKN